MMLRAALWLAFFALATHTYTISRSRHLSTPLAGPLFEAATKSFPSSNFLFTTVKAGSEKALKGEFAKKYPDMRSAFSRPGLVTWKQPSLIRSDIEIDSCFASTYGVSLQQVANASEVVKVASSLNKQMLCLHVYAREETGAASKHPDAIAAKNKQVERIRNEVLNVAPPGLFQAGQKDQYKANEGNHVLHVIVGDDEEKLILGLSQHSSRFSNNNAKINHSPYPGGYMQHIVLPPEAPSRAFLKIEEAIEWAQLDMTKGDLAVEIGSAPGGACYSLLKRGLTVIGIDPSPQDRTHAPIVANHKGFKAIKKFVRNVDVEKEIPRRVDWLLCDANVEPEEVIIHLNAMVSHFDPTVFKGLIWTIKFGDLLWSNQVDITDHIDDITARLCKASPLFELVQMTQLPSNRQEMLLLALTKQGIKRVRDA